MSKRVTIAVLGAAALTGTAVVAARMLRDEHRRTRISRSARVWRLTVRRGAHLAVVKVRGRAVDAEKRAKLEERFAIRTAEDVAQELGHMKGAIMKLGQLIGFIAEGLPDEAQRALATLQADVPPMAPSLAESVIRDDLGVDPEHLFLDWDPVPVAAASVGQVHRAVMRDGREVAVKVQYPGVDKAIKSDLDNAEALYSMFASVKLKGLDVKALVDELRARMGDELDYRLEARNQSFFAELYRGHPFIRIPEVIPELSNERVLTSEWVEGLTWAQFEAHAGLAERQKAGEVLFRFAQGSVHRHGVFNGDPHPGNYRFHRDGSITFLDFGLVKRWTPGEWEQLSPCLDAVIASDPETLLEAMERVGFLKPGHGLEANAVFEYVSSPYVPYLTQTFRFTRRFVADALAKVLDVDGPYSPVIRALNMPPSFVILDRVVWGVSALLGKLQAQGPWRAVLMEYRRGAPPATEMGKLDAAWWQTRRQPAR